MNIFNSIVRSTLSLLRLGASRRAKRPRDGGRVRSGLDRARRSRNTIIAALICFLCLQWILAAAAEGPLADLRNPLQTVRERRLKALLSEQPNRPLVLALGSSQTLWGLQAGKLCGPTSSDPLVFNFGMHAYGPVHQFAALEGLRAQRIEPSGLILEIMPGLLNAEPAADDTHGKGFLNWTETVAVARITGSRRGYGLWFLVRSAAWFKYRHRLQSRFLPSWVPATFAETAGIETDPYGWYADTRAPDPQQAEHWRQLYQTRLRSFFVPAVNDRALREMLSTCRSRQVPVLLLIPPEGPTFRSWYSAEFESALQNYLSAISSEYRVRLIDARGWLESESEFIDGVHLTPTGAAQFTERLGREAAVFFAEVKAQGRH
jgi:hypothetical protein